MSEYQYYEFLAIDRPLTPDEQEAVVLLVKLRDLAVRQGKGTTFSPSWRPGPIQTY